MSPAWNVFMLDVRKFSLDKVVLAGAAARRQLLRKLMASRFSMTSILLTVWS